MILSHRFYITRKLSLFLSGQDWNIFYCLYCFLTKEPKNISVIIRAKNEEKFLEASVRSIIDNVEEVVIIDNNSTDRTPEIIANLVKEYPQKVRAYKYKYNLAHTLAKPLELFALNPHSPYLQSTHCNWCLQKTTYPYVMRWDADMIATPAFIEVLSHFKKTIFQSLHFTGRNIYSDYKHYCLAHPASESRVFRKKYARYITSNNCTLLKTPIFLLRFFSLKCCYLHLKMCKADPLSNRPDIDSITALQFSRGKKVIEEDKKILSAF